jgi:tungstate transport system substrate-binding protein
VLAALVPPGALAQGRPAAEGPGGAAGWRLMNSDLVLVGPAADPPASPACATPPRRCAASPRRGLFVSRGDRSAAHEAELRFWRAAGVDPAQGRGRWYREVTQGMGAALDAAAAQGAYVLADRGAWLALRERRGLRIVVEDDRRFSD